MLNDKDIHNNFEESKKDISDKWLDKIDDSLKRLEFYERQLRVGHQNIFEYINGLGFTNPYVKTCLAQIEATTLMIEEFEIIFTNTEKIIANEKMIELKNKLVLCRNISSGKYGECHKGLHEFKKGKSILTKVIFKKPFDDLLKELSELRRELVNELSHLLWIGRENKEERAEE